MNPEIAKVLSGESDGCIVCGDCLDVMRTMPDGCVDLVLTDPPYGHNNNNNGDLIHRWEAALGRLPCGEDPPLARPIANDGEEANDLFKDALPEFRRLLKPGCCCCCGGGGGPDPQFARWSIWMDKVFQYKQQVVWDKGPMGMGWHYRRSYETVLVAQVPGAACKWYGGRTVENIIRPGDYGIRKIIPSAEDHPTPKPVELALHFIRLHSEPGDIVLDAFAGYGWVGVAAKMLGRRYIGIEISEDYCEIARQRLEAVETGVPVNEQKAGQMALFGDSKDSHGKEG